MNNEYFDVEKFRNEELRSEDEIISSWESNEQKVKVSFACITFNQESYIEDTIKGFLKQKTNFPIEIIIHDDNSTDKTKEILLKYKEKYPKLIVLILQDVNQYKISPNKPLQNLFNKCNGDYIAICEGDDFWVDEKKLQKQLHALTSYEGIDICFTSAVGIYPDNKYTILADHSEQLTVYSISKVVRSGGGFMPTPSLFIKRTVLVNLPTWFQDAKIGDFFIQILGSLNGGALFLPDKTVIYRIMGPNSWTSNNFGENLYQHRIHTAEMFSNVSVTYPHIKNDLYYTLRRSDFMALKSFIKNRQFKLIVRMTKKILLDALFRLK